MKKFASVLQAFILFLLATFAITGTAHATLPIHVTLDGRQVHFSGQGPVIIDGRTLVPARGVFEEMGFIVAWSGEERTASLIAEGITINVSLGSPTMAITTHRDTPHINLDHVPTYRIADVLESDGTIGTFIYLDTPAQMVNNRVLIPLRAVAEATGAHVQWDSAARMAIITTGATLAQPPTPLAAPGPVPPAGLQAIRLPLHAGEEAASQLQQLMAAAQAQAIARDRTPLVNPVEWRFLWLPYTHVQAQGQTVRMSDSHRAQVAIIPDEFKRIVETAVPYITIHNTTVIMEDLLVIPQEPATMALGVPFITQQLIQDDLVRLGAHGHYDIVFVLTPIGSGVLFDGGFAAAPIHTGLGYGGVSFWESRPLTPGRIMFYETGIAIHEFLHLLEGAYFHGFLPGVQFPSVHGTLNYPQYANYGVFQYNPSLGNWLWYEQILQGRVLYAGRYEIGMFPNMWQLTPRAIASGQWPTIGRYQIRNGQGQYLFNDGGQLQAGPLTPNDPRFVWTVRGTPATGFTITPANAPGLFVDVDNAWGREGNGVKLWPWTGVVNAQTWYLRQTNNPTPSYYIVTRLSQSLGLGITDHGDPQLFYLEDARAEWFFVPVGY